MAGGSIPSGGTTPPARLQVVGSLGSLPSEAGRYTSLMALTRIDIVQNGVKEYWADEWHMYLQDEGQTLKLVAKGDGSAPKEARDEALAKFFAEHLSRLPQSED